MKKYDFDHMLERKGKDALALDGLDKPLYPQKPKEAFDPIPMWVADMNFPTASSIQDAIIKRASHPAFGYFLPKDDYYDAIIDWHKKKKGVEDIRKENIGYENGVLGGLISALNVFASRGDNILVHSPTYIGFTMSLKNNGFNIIHSDLIKDDQGKWVIDYEDMEKKIVENKIGATIFCNPHNPTGRVWTKEEIKKCMDIFEKHQVKVISDEIWSDLLMNGSVYTPTQSVSSYAKENTVALYAPSKTFNLAGLIGAYHIIYNDRIKMRVEKESSLSNYNSMNVLSMYALIGAYSKEGEDWLDQLLEVLSKNVNYAYDFIKNDLEGIDLFKPQGTYMIFLDLEKYCKKTGKDIGEIIKKGWEVGVIWQDGRDFGGDYTIRMNLAVPHKKVIEAFDRLKKYVLD